MTRSLLLILTLTACAHHAAPFGWYGRQCIPQRAVLCALDQVDCAKLATAIDTVNGAVGRRVYQYAGTLAYKDLQSDFGHLFASGVYVFMYSKITAYGLTNTVGDPQVGKQECLIAAYTSISPEVPDELTSAVLTHELLHGLGATDAQAGGAYGTIMAPGSDVSNFRTHITAYDLAAIRSQY